MKLLHVGWDDADWQTLGPLVDRGLMPCLGQLVDRGGRGNLHPVRPFDRAALWMSLATGGRPALHGILQSSEGDEARAAIRPVSRRRLRMRPVWELLSQAGYAVHAVGWPASHPAQTLNGICVSDHFASIGELASIAPPGARVDLLALRLDASEVDFESIVELWPPARQWRPRVNPCTLAISEFLVHAASTHAVATWALAKRPWDFAAVRYGGVTRLIAAMASHHPADDAVQGLRERAWQFFDRLLARLVELAGDAASVILASPSGPPGAGRRSRLVRPPPAPGIYVASGPAFKQRGIVPDGNVCDVAATIRDVFKLADDASSNRGGSAPAATTLRETRDEIDGEDANTHALTNPAADDADVAHLLDLGYRERSDPFLHIAIDRLHQQRLLREAEAWIDCGNLQHAAESLARLVERAPRSIAYRGLLAEVSFRLRAYAECRQVIEELQQTGVDTPLLWVGLAALAAREGNTAEAVDQLRRAESFSAPPAAVSDVIGRLYLSLRRRADAARAFEAVLQNEPDNVAALQGRAATRLLLGDAEAAVTDARKAVTLAPDSYEAHYLLGAALARLAKDDEAIDALRRAASLKPDGAGSAHRRLAELFAHRGEHALAFHHRSLAEQAKRTAQHDEMDLPWITDGFER